MHRVTGKKKIHTHRHRINYIQVLKAFHIGKMFLMKISFFLLTSRVLLILTG